LACDHFYLTVNVPPSYWDTHTGGAEIEIHWLTADDDYDLYVYDSAGLEVGRSGAGGTTSEKVFIQNASDNGATYDYEVRVVPFLIVSVPTSKADGSATFVSQAGGPAPNPTRGTGGLAFGPATVIDAQRTEGEPLNHVDKYGHHWETGPWGFSTAQMFVHRSTDSGDQFNIVSPNGLRPNPTFAGGGDSDVTTDDQGFAYFADLEGLLQIGCGVSNDNGNTWREQNACVNTTLDDRQWLAADNGSTTAATDNTVFLAYNAVGVGSFIYSTPGSTGSGDLIGGLLYTNSSSNLLTPVQTASPCGQLRFDPVDRYLYYPCVAGDHVQITRGQIPVGTRTGIMYSNVQAPPSPGGDVGDLFPNVAIDKDGNIYAVWIDSIDHNVYYAYSEDHGTTWSSVRQVNGNDTNSNVFPWAVAGNAGKLVVGWYSTTSHLDSDNMPSWYNNRAAATAFKWNGYVSLITNANGATPVYAQQKFTEKPMHYGQICNGGIGCTVSGGDRTMADYFALTLDLDGSIRIVYNDTTSQHHGAHLFEQRQLAGPSATTGTISKPIPKNPMTDAGGDARSPHYFPLIGPGANQDALDFVTTSVGTPALRLSQPSAGTLRVQMRLQNLSALSTTGKTTDLWLTRFQAPSLGDQGEESHRLFYVGAERPVGASPSAITFFAGSGMSAQPPGVPGNGCTTTTPQNCKITQYPNEVVVTTGSVSGNVITIDVPIQGGFGANRPVFGDTLYNVTALSAGRTAPDPNLPADPNLVYADVDATRSFDYRLSGPIIEPPPPSEEGCKITGGGAVPVLGGEGKFSLIAHVSLKGKVDYRDPNDGFRSTRLTGVTCDTSAHRGEITGTGTNNGENVTFTVEVVDNGESGSTDVFQIDISNGDGGGGTLTRGNIQVHD
jgi:hypothetical protein